MLSLSLESLEYSSDEMGSSSSLIKTKIKQDYKKKKKKKTAPVLLFFFFI